MMKTIQSQVNNHKVMNNQSVISFENISFSLIGKQKLSSGVNQKRVILRNIDGFFHKGLNAILGSSGAGKTSLLNILAKRVESSKTTELSGEAFVNNQAYTSEDFSKFAGYVMQDDLLLSNLTVKEYIQFAADLRLDISHELRVQKAQSIIKLLQLERCQNTLIGDQMTKGISGGERKRTSIGLELIGEPSVIFLDEPTSGLDSFTAYTVMKILKDIAEKKNSTIIFTIHQPSSDLWNLFDRVLFLVEGQFIYQGPRENVIEYFNQIGFNCPIHNNPPDYIMQVIQRHPDQQEYLWNNYHQRRVDFDNNVSIFRQRAQNSLCQIQANDVKTIQIQTEFDEENQIAPQYTILNLPRALVTKGFFEMTRVLIGRQILYLKRHKIMIRTRAFQVVTMGLFNTILFLNLKNGYDDYKAIQQRAVVFYLFPIGMLFQSLNPQVISFSQERPVFLKEHGAGMYSSLSYFISKIIPETFSCTLFAIIFGLIFYWPVGFRNEVDHVIMFLFIMILVSNIGNALGLLIGSIFQSPKLSISLSIVFMLPILLFGGVFKNRADYPTWIGWIEYLNPTFYAFNAFVENEFRGLPYKYSPFDMFHLDFGKWKSIGMMIVLYFAFLISGYLCLRRHTKKLQ